MLGAETFETFTERLTSLELAVGLKHTEHKDGNSITLKHKGKPLTEITYALGVTGYTIHYLPGTDPEIISRVAKALTDYYDEKNP